MSVMNALRKPGRPRNEAIDTAVLNAAVEEFIDKGWGGLSMEAVAARAGVAKTTIYRRWPSLEELCIAAVCSLGSEQDTPLPDGDSVRDELLAQLERMRRKWTNPGYAALMRRASADAEQQPEVYQQMRQRIVGPAIEAMNATLRRGVREGIMRADVDIDWARQLLSSPILSGALTMKTRMSRAQVEFTLDTVLRGLAP
jgi:AcrR family transcriptional regulator